MGNVEKKVMLKDFISKIELRDIDIIRIENSKSKTPEIDKSGVDVSFKFLINEEDPFIFDDNTMFALRPLLEMQASINDEVFFEHTSGFSIQYSIEDPSALESINDGESLRFFLNESVTPLLWPFFRQHINEGMTKLGLPAYTLSLLDGN